VSRAARALAWLRARLRPPRTLRPTRAGWMFFLITFGVGFAALNTGNNLLYLVLSLMLAFLVLSGLLSEAALRGIAVRRRVPSELFAGTPCRIGLEISNRQRRVPSFAVVIEDRAADAGSGERAAGRVFALRVGPGQTETRAYRFEPGTRGELRFTRFLVYTRFPFGLFSKSLAIEAPQRSLVFPGIEPLGVPRDFGAPRESGAGRTGARDGGALVSGLRAFAAGDAVARVHWAASLRRRELLVREIEADRRPEVEVRLRTRDAPGPRFERAVRWAASEVVALLEAGHQVALATDAERLPPGTGAAQRIRLLSYLARVRAAGSAREAA
jgi:uncharacterized protein (DUF58 family)